MKTNRYFILVMASVVNLVHGHPYIWTVFQPYVREEYHMTLAASSLPFTANVGIFALGNVLGGYFQHRIGAKRTVMAGSAIMLGGFLISAFAPLSMPWLITVGYGLMGGIGSGFIFSNIVAVMQVWFPDKRGLVTGITIGIVGVSGMLTNPLCDYMLNTNGYRFTMLMLIVIYGVFCLCGLLIEEAPEGYEQELLAASAVEGQMSDGSKGNVAAETEAAEQRQYTTREMMGTGTYYAISIAMALIVPAYLLVNPLMKSLGMERGLTSAQALTGVVIASFANIIGRFAVPWISDKTGCKFVIRILFVIAGISVIGLIAARGGLFILLITLVCMVYGGVVSVFPVLVSEHFGMKYQAMNNGAIMFGYGIVSILCPMMLGGLGLVPSLVAAGAACAVGLFTTRYF